MFQGLGMRFRLLVALLLFSSLSGCVSVEVQEVKPEPGVVSVAITAHPLTNMDLSGRPSPTVVRLYQLRKDVDFNEADFFSLYDGDKALLSADLLAREEFVVAPGSFSTNAFDIHPDAKFVAFLAAFQNTNNAVQKQMLPIVPEQDLSLVIHLNDNTISVAANDTQACANLPGLKGLVKIEGC